VLVGSWFAADAEELVRRGRKQLVFGDSRAALETAGEVLERNPNHVSALLLVADANFELEEYDRALGYYRRVPRDHSQDAVYAQFRCGRIEFHHVGDTVAAESSFRSALEQDPDNRNGLFQLVSLLGIQSRSSEAVPFILRLFRQGVFHQEFLDLLESGDSALFNLKELQRYQRATPDSAGVLMGLAWHARKSGQPVRAASLLEQAIQNCPGWSPARVALAALLWEDQQLERLRVLVADGNTVAVDDARMWNVRGFLAEHEGQVDAAARCFWEARRLDPTSRVATYRLYQYLSSRGFDELVSALRIQVDRLQVLQERSDVVRSTEHASSFPVRQLVEALEDVGRLWEAWGWCVVARDLYSDADWVEPKLAAFSHELESAPLRVVCRDTLPVELDLSHLPLPNWSTESIDTQETTSVPKSAVSFRDDAKAAGLSFQYFNNPSLPGTGQRMYEFNGGGAGVLDYDRDGWPDLHFTQGCEWPVREERIDSIDRLYRNSAAGEFDDVTVLARVLESGFSTGMAIGDVDNDGFPDIYVANIGRNRLLRNYGDGTFEDITSEAGVDDPRWSTSCVMADLNGDGLPDIYSVNYVTGDSVFTDVCQHEDGHPRMCMPFHFPGDQDQLYLNRGDGRFDNVTAESGIEIANGKGLGVVAVDWTQNGRLTLFVANDTVANFLFANKGNDADGIPQFHESGLISGAALNRDGRAEGCMGIAAGDANSDGTVDLFVTNFLRETNSLYLASDALMFDEVTRDAGLAEPSRDVLGFGTQFLDADLDGHLDLLISNGHIDDYRKYGRPYAMPAQFFVNDGAGRFTEQPAADLGPYFERRLLGRGMSRLDWNRDGLEDAVISHLDQPAALLTNTTASLEPRRFVTVRLCGAISARDAHGATVVVQSEGRRITRQLTAGDGYQASNERALVFGLGQSETIHQISVRWPSGLTETFSQASPNREYVVIEGAGRITTLRAMPD